MSDDYRDGVERGKREAAELCDPATPEGRCRAIRFFTQKCQRNATAPWADDYERGYLAGMAA